MNIQRKDAQNPHTDPKYTILEVKPDFSCRVRLLPTTNSSPPAFWIDPETLKNDWVAMGIFNQPVLLIKYWPSTDDEGN